MECGGKVTHPCDIIWVETGETGYQSVLETYIN